MIRALSFRSGKLWVALGVGLMLIITVIWILGAWQIRSVSQQLLETLSHTPILGVGDFQDVKLKSVEYRLKGFPFAYQATYVQPLVFTVTHEKNQKNKVTQHLYYEFVGLQFKVSLWQPRKVHIQASDIKIERVNKGESNLLFVAKDWRAIWNFNPQAKPDIQYMALGALQTLWDSEQDNGDVIKVGVDLDGVVVDQQSSSMQTKAPLVTHIIGHQPKIRIEQAVLPLLDQLDIQVALHSPLLRWSEVHQVVESWEAQFTESLQQAVNQGQATLPQLKTWIEILENNHMQWDVTVQAQYDQNTVLKGNFDFKIEQLQPVSKLAIMGYQLPSYIDFFIKNLENLPSSGIFQTIDFSHGIELLRSAQQDLTTEQIKLVDFSLDNNQLNSDVLMLGTADNAPIEIPSIQWEQLAIVTQELAESFIPNFSIGYFRERRAEQSLQLDNSDSQVAIALGYSEDLEYAKAQAWFEKASEDDHPIALYYLSYYYFSGIIAETEQTQAVSYLKRAIEKGSYESLIQIIDDEEYQAFVTQQLSE